MYESPNGASEDVLHQTDSKTAAKDTKKQPSITTNDLTKTVEVFLNKNGENQDENNQITQEVDLHSDELAISSEVSNVGLPFPCDESSAKSREKSNLNYNENLMMIDDDCAILPDSITSTKIANKKSSTNDGSSALLILSKNQPKSNNSSAVLSASLKACFKINVEQLRAGLTTSTSKITSSLSNKETKDLSLIQLYLALNKPSVICLKYDWIITQSHSGCSNFAKPHPVANIADNAESNSSLFTLNSSQNQQQRFYIETLANVGASFLNDLHSKNSNAASANVFVAPTALPCSNNVATSNLPLNGISKTAAAVFYFYFFETVLLFKGEY